MSAGVQWAIEALVASSILIALVLLVRGPVRRAFGPGVAYALWALPVLRLALPPLPAAVTTPIAAVGEQVTVLIVPSDAVATVTAAGPVEVVASAFPVGMALALAWGAGALALIGWHTLAYFRLRARLLRGATRIDRVGGIDVIEAAAAKGPLAFGIARRYVAFPRDFAGRYDAAEREMALAHEIGHHARGDLVANWVALAALAFQWFSPLAWIAFRAFRNDQEMANDARVMAGRGAGDRHAYACAIVKAAHGGAISAVCHLHTIDDLKGRLRMLGMARASRTRMMMGGAGVAALTLAGLGATASGGAAAAVRTTVRTTVEEVTGVSLPPSAPAVAAQATPPAAPATPADPVKTRRHRVVIVKDGKATTYEGAEADAFVAANPVAAAPVPPVPPVVGAGPDVPAPPLPPGVLADGTSAGGTSRVRTMMFRSKGTWPAGVGETFRITMPVIRSETCSPIDGQPVINRTEKGQRVVMLCKNRIERMGQAAAEHAAKAAQTERSAYVSALNGLRGVRAGIAANANIPPDGRAQALASIDTSIAELEANLAKAR